MKLAHTIADLAGCEEIQSAHLAALTVCLAKALHAHLHCAQAQVSQSSEVDAGIKSAAPEVHDKAAYLTYEDI